MDVRSLRSVLERVMGRRLVMYRGSVFFLWIRMVCVSDHEGGGWAPWAIWLKIFARMDRVGERKIL